MALSSYCSVCRQLIDEFVPGGTDGQRLRAHCPACFSLERNRYYGVLFAEMYEVFSQARVVLDIAPSPALEGLIRRDLGGLHLTCDIDPAADGRNVVLRSDLTRLAVADRSVDLLMCTHVLEHIPDDRAAMREIRRVLSPSGIAFINVPHRRGVPTDEDVEAKSEERISRFGQADHVRFYGDDFDDRLRSSGIGILPVTSDEVFGPELSHALGMLEGETFWFAWRDGAAPPPAILPSSEQMRTRAYSLIASANRVEEPPQRSSSLRRMAGRALRSLGFRR